LKIPDYNYLDFVTIKEKATFKMNDVLLNNALNRLETGVKALFVWSGKNVPEGFQAFVERVQSRCGTERVAVEHADRLTASNHQQSTFDCILANLLTPDSAVYSAETLANYLRILKPKGFLVAFHKDSPKLESELTLGGYLSLQKEVADSVLSIYAEKPNFEIGVSRPLKFAAKVQEAKKQEAVVGEKPKVWQFSADDVQEDDLINTDELLDAVDVLKPVVDANFDCGTSKEGKKKACKNCTCGLAEEIESEASDKQKKNVAASNVKSACGSCYLGDAFRCASCPYLGMPAFKPGEKVQLSEFNKVDI
jgi:hypothetical protein